MSERTPMAGQDWFSDVYADGCDLAPSCFTCPLSACRYEMPPGRAKAELQRHQVATLAAEGKHWSEIAMVVGLEKRQVYRYLHDLGLVQQRRPAPLPIIEPSEVFVDGRPACVRCRWAPRMIAATIAFEMTPRGLVCRREDECRTRQRGAA